MTQQTQHAENVAEEKSAAEEAAVKGSAAEHEGKEDVAPEERQRLIAEAAYLIAEGRGFQGDRALDDWLQAEAEVDARFAAKH